MYLYSMLVPLVLDNLQHETLEHSPLSDIAVQYRSSVWSIL